MKKILAQCKKELAQFQRDKLTLALAFVLPFMSLLIFGFAVRLEKKNIPYNTRRSVNILEQPMIQNLRMLLALLRKIAL